MSVRGMRLWTIQREASANGTTFGKLLIDNIMVCYTLEDEIREIPGAPVVDWKVPKQTAIPAGRYQLSFEDSPKFGPQTITVNKVPGFEYIRIHGGNTAADTEGCIIVGATVDRDQATISGARTQHTLATLKNIMQMQLVSSDVWLDVVNPKP